MFELAPEIDIREDEAEAIARGLLAVAKADGTLHEREAALIADFYGSIHERPIDVAVLDRLERVDGHYLATMLADEGVRTLFVKTAILLAYADGNYSAAESKTIQEYAGALGLSDKLADLEQQVKEFMLGQLTDIRNTQAVAEVAKELKA
jgi:tellurite resistance protein